jgi:hypothetical protein
MPPWQPTSRPITRLPRGVIFITDGWAGNRVTVNSLHNDEIRRYNVDLWELPMNRKHVFKLPLDAWRGIPPIAGLPKKMRAIRQATPAQWLVWAAALNLAIRPTDTLQIMVDRYLLWLGLPRGANLANRA